MKIKVLILTSFVAKLLVASDLVASDLFLFQGPYHRVSGGAGLIESVTGAATFHNPANLSRQPSHAYFDFGLTKLEYRFTAKGRKNDSGALSTNVPLLSFGGGIQLSDRCHTGIAILPLGLRGQEAKTEDFPVKIGGSVIVSDLVTEQASFKGAVGFSCKFNKILNFGFGVIYHHNENKTTVLGSDPDEPLISIKENSRFMAPIIGFSETLGRVTWAGTYTLAQSAPYRTSLEESGNDPQIAEGETYQAASFGLGVAYRWIPYLNPYVQYHFERWSLGQDRSASGVGKLIEGEGIGTDFRNTHNFVLGNKIYFANHRTFYLSFAKYDANKATGVYDDRGRLLYEGVKQRDFEGLTRVQGTMGLSFLLWDRQMTSYFSYMKASADAPEGTPSEGLYELKLMMLGTGFVF